MPGGLDDTKRIFAWLRDALGPGTYVNVMDQHYPAGLVAQKPERWPELDRRITSREHREALSLAKRYELRIDRRAPHPLLGRSF